MITAMIVDDEAIIRKGIMTAVDWESVGIQVLEEAGNGRDGLAKALLKKPDIIITDIRMPIMDGIHFSKEVREKLPNSKIVFLSGYNDTEYLRQAIKIGAADYLLKPVSVQELTSLMTKLKGQIEEEHKNYISKIQTNQILKRNLPWLRSKCVNKFINGEISEEQFYDEASKTLDIDLSGPYFQIAAFSIDNFYLMVSGGEKETELLKYSLSNIAAEILSRVAKITICDGSASILIALLSTKTETDEIVDCCKEIQFYVKKYFNFSVTVGIGEKVKELSGLKLSWQQAIQAVESRISEGNNRVIIKNGRDLKKYDEVKMFLNTQEENELKDNLRSLNKARLKEILGHIFENYFYGQAIDRKTAEQICMSLILIAIKEMEQCQISAKEILQQDYLYYNEISKYETLKDLELWIKTIYNKTLYAIEAQRSNKYKSIVTIGMDYARKHYSESILVADIAEVVCVTPNYFSKIFKEETGENFTEWFNKYRIEMAKKIMITQPVSKIYQIAEEVGFSDYKYFTYIFKKYTGYTPNTYKQLLG